MKKVACIGLFSLISVLSCKKHPVSGQAPASMADSVAIPQKTEEGLPVKKYDYEVGWMEDYEKLPKLEFIEIRESEFHKVPKDSVRTMPQIDMGDEEFAIQTWKKRHVFDLYRDYGGVRGHEGHEYLGYYPGLKLFAITSNWTGESMGFGKLVLIDSITDKEYGIVSIGDVPVELPLPSINNKFMVYYDNWMYDHKDCTICVVQIGNKANPDDYLREYRIYESHDFAIDEIRWIDDNSFVVRGYEDVYENGDWTKKFKYYKTSFE